MKHRIFLLLAGLTASFGVLAQSATVALALSADSAAHVALSGAVVVDVRDPGEYLAGHIPGAVQLTAPLAGDDRSSLQELVSRKGIDLSRDVVLVGRAGDDRAQRLQARLTEYATGRVFWLVGGVDEWRLSGRGLVTQAVSLPPVPQYLVPLQPQTGAARMAAASLRDVRAPSLALQAQASPKAPI